MNTFIQQGLIKLIKSDIYNVTNDSILNTGETGKNRICCKSSFISAIQLKR